MLKIKKAVKEVFKERENKEMSGRQFQDKAIRLAPILIVFALLHFQCTTNNSQAMKENQSELKISSQNNEYVGMWVTGDGHIRQELLANNRYDEARGEKKTAYQGRYKITGKHIDYWDDTGFTADGEFRDGILYHGGYVFYKENK